MRTWREDYFDQRLDEIATKFGKGSEIYRLYVALYESDLKCETALKQRNAACDALRKYGCHKPECNRLQGSRLQDWPCDCGFDAAIKAIPDGV